MKKKLIALVAALALILSVLALAACTEPATTDVATGNPNNATGEAILDELPSNLPDSNHIGRMELQRTTHSECYTCHGWSAESNPIDPTARIVPESHYVNESYGSGAFEPGHQTCDSCHAGPAPAAS